MKCQLLAGGKKKLDRWLPWTTAAALSMLLGVDEAVKELAWPEEPTDVLPNSMQAGFGIVQELAVRVAAGN